MRDQLRGEVRLTPRQRRVAVEVVKVLTSQEAIAGPAPSVETVELLADATLQTRMAAWDVLTPPTPDFRNIVSAFDVPALLVIGDAPVVTREVAADLQTVNKRLRVEEIANAGHGVPYDQPEKLAELIGVFARSL